jgi:amino acid adenylation domain-containing protein
MVMQKKYQTTDNRNVRNVIDYLEFSAARFPNKIVFSDEDKAVTYDEFVCSARSFGATVAEIVRGCRLPIAILCERSVDSLIAMFGVLYSGNFYAPLDVELPKKKLHNILTRLDPMIIVTSQERDGLERSVPEDYMGIVHDFSEIMRRGQERNDKHNIPVNIDIDPAYVLHTSGSTGEPKGVLVTHKALIDFTEDYVHSIGISETDIIGSQPPFPFDASIRGIFPTLKAGASMHIHSKKGFTYLSQLSDEIRDRKINVLSWSTSAFHLVANSGLLAEDGFPEQVSKVIVGGETLHAKQLNIWRRALPNVAYYNVYGPSEVIDCTYCHLIADYQDTDRIPIGVPYPNKDVFVLAEGGTQAAVGEPGEICVRGSGLASGYSRNRALTDAVFIRNPLDDRYSERIYKTGDIGEMNADGMLYFCGRRDGQIKHNGYRVELGEIERAVSSLDGVSVNACFHDEAGEKLICVYEGTSSKAEVMRGLRPLLPRYMLPNAFIPVETIPLNQNGKVDRLALREKYVKD